MGLEYLHKCGVVHGDIKGRNILVSSSIKGIVTDFGLAKLVDTRTASSQRGQGTIQWQSPEMLLGGPRTFKSDVYAFGITAYEARRSQKISTSYFSHIKFDLPNGFCRSSRARLLLLRFPRMQFSLK